MKPIVKWPGGKASISKAVTDAIPHFSGTYYEPFCGGMAVYLSMWQSIGSAALSDASPQLMAMYRAVRHEPKGVASFLQRLVDGYSGALDKEKFYYGEREEFNASPNHWGIVQAARFLFLNKTCYNGLWRVNSRNEFNAPFGRYKSPAFPTADAIYALSDALQGTELMSCDFEVAMCQGEEGDFIYVDSPYHGKYDQYTAEKFSETDQVRLSVAVKRATEAGAKVLVSNSDTEFIRGLYADFDIQVVGSNHQRINSKASGRGATSELLIRCW